MIDGCPSKEGRSDRAGTGGQPRGPLSTWLRPHTFAPAWLPGPWRRPLVGFAIAAFASGGALALEYLLTMAFPGFAFPGAISYVVVVGVALTWGAGPALYASLRSALALNFFVLAPRFAWNRNGLTDLVGFFISLAAFTSLSIISSLAEGRRQQLVTRQARLESLQAVTAALTAVRTPEEVAEVIAREGTRVLGARAAHVHVARRQPEPSRQLAADPDGGHEAVVSLPLRVADRVIGDLVVVYRPPWLLLAEERDFLETLSDLTAQALDRARHYQLVGHLLCLWP